MPPRPAPNRSATQGRVGADPSPQAHGPSQRAGLGRPYDDDYTRDRGRNNSLDNIQIDPSLEQVTPLGDRYGQRRTNVDSGVAQVSTGQRKRATCDAITASVNRASKRRKDLENEEASELHHAARIIPRIIGPFTNVQETILIGIELEARRAAGNYALGSSKNLRIQEDYEKILNSVSGLKELVAWTLENNPGALNDLACMLDRASAKGRSDDCGSLRENGLKYIPRIEGIPVLEPNVRKERRGFLHLSTARLLCPRELRDYFDKDRERFCRQILEASLVITHDDLPSFLFPKELYNPDNIDEYLLQSPFMLACYRHLFTGPRTALKETPGKSPGRKCIAELYDIREVTPATIAYVAVLCRHVLNAKESWSINDGPGFNAERFYQNILDLFDDDVWAEETLNWWNDRVFGDDYDGGSAATTEPKETELQRLTKQRAARRALPSSQTQASAPTEEEVADDNGALA